MSPNDTLNQTDSIEEHETQYTGRNESLRVTIDTLAQYDQATIDTHGSKAKIAREHDIEQHQIHYVLDRWRHLVKWRRHANGDPLDPDAVKEAYDDPTMQAMATGGTWKYECPDCGRQFDESPQLRGHLTHGCTLPTGVTMEDTRTLVAGEGSPQTAVADGASNLTVPIELSLDEVFRAVKLLPGDLGLKVYAQTLEADLPHDQVRRILSAGE